MAITAFYVMVAEPDGDSASAIADVERRIAAIEHVLRLHTYEIRDEGSPPPTDPARAFYRLRGQQGEVFHFEGPDKPGDVDVEQIVDELFMRKSRQYVAYEQVWTEVQSIWSDLTEDNRRIAEAKALRYFTSRPTRVSPEAWNDRVRRSESPWRIRTS